MKKVYYFELGILRDKNEVDEMYSSVYDQQHGYCNKYQGYFLTKEEAVKHVDDYVNNGVIGVYGIVKESYVDDYVYQQIVTDDCVEIDETYSPKDVVYSSVRKKIGLEYRFIKA